MTDWHYILGLAAGLLQATALPIYVRDIFRGGTKPSKVTWWVLAFLNAILAASYYAAGARATIWIPIVYAAGFLLIAILSIKYGEGKWTTFDRVCLGGAVAAGFVLWFAHSPQLALYTTVIIDFFGLLPTIIKSYRQPHTENRTSWTIATLASVLNVFAIETWTVAIALYPLYVVITNSVVVYFITFSGRFETHDDTA